MVTAACVALELVDAKSPATKAPSESTESTDISSSEDAISAIARQPQSPASQATATPQRRLVQWSDLLDARMLARDTDLDMDDSEGPMPDAASPVRNTAEDYDEDDMMSQSTSQSKRRSRRRQRHKVKAIHSDSSTTAASRSPSSWGSERDEIDFFYSRKQAPAMFTGFPTHCDSISSSGVRGKRNVVTVNDILGQDLSLGPKATSSQGGSRHALNGAAQVFTPMPTCTVSSEYSAAPQADYGPWIDTCEAGARTAWHAPLVTPWNPPYWESSVYAVDKAPSAEPLTSWLQASGLTCSKNDLAEQLRAVAPVTYED